MDWMRYALELAKKGQNSCPPNPMVGCVIIKNNKVIGQGFHQITGGPHAEIIALEQAKEHALGADLYVTLEPCSHFGRTPPCVDAIIKANIKRVFVALKDANPQVNSQGIKKLKEAGIDVNLGLYQEEAYKINEDFFYAMTHQRPFVIAKWAMSLDGKIATAFGQSKYITSENALTHAHGLRARVCAIMIGANTLRLDKPELNVRYGDKISRQPRPIIISTQENLDLNFNIFKAERRPVIITSDKVSQIFLKSLAAKKIDHHVFKLHNRRFNMKEVLNFLRVNYELKSVLVEGGSVLLTALHEEKLINQIYTYIAPTIMGGKKSLTPIVGKNLNNMNLMAKLHSEEVTYLDPDICFSAKTSISPKNYNNFLELQGS